MSGGSEDAAVIAMTASLPQTLYGTDEVVPASLALHARGLSLVLRGAKVWHIRCGEREVWHGVAFLFRDADWGTPEPIVDDVQSRIGESDFTLAITGRFPVEPAIDFKLRIEGSASGIRVDGEAVPRGDILASRLGLCVMHPMSVCGAPIEVEHTDGRLSRSTFPTLIPAWPPFMLIRAIRHEYAPGAFARCTFDGDAFELEDQRNNSDASFKTYSRSNLMPRPYWLRGGVAVKQSVELRLESAHGLARRTVKPAAMRVRVGDEAGALPKVGIEITAHDAKVTDGVRAALRALGPAHLHLALDAESHMVDWTGIKRLLDAASAGLRLDLSVDYAKLDALEALGVALREADLVPARIAIFPSEARCLDAARRAFPGAPIGGGTPHFFVQLNRIERLGEVDFLTFTTSPIVHGADDEIVMLTLESLPSMLDTLRDRYPEARFAIGPSTIGVRRSPLGNQPTTDGLHRVALARHDPRCRGLFGAAWVLGYVAQCAQAGVDALTLMSLTGPSGVVVADAAEDEPMRTPAYWVLERLSGAIRSRQVMVSQPTHVAALSLQRADGRSELLMANLTANAIDVEIDGPSAVSSLAMLDAVAWNEWGATAANFWVAAPRRPAGRRVTLAPYAVVSLM